MGIAVRLLTISAVILLGAFVNLQKATISCAMSVCLSVLLPVCPSVYQSAWNNSARTRQIFMKFYI